MATAMAVKVADAILSCHMAALYVLSSQIDAYRDVASMVLSSIVPTAGGVTVTRGAQPRRPQPGPRSRTPNDGPLVAGAAARDGARARSSSDRR